MITWQHLNLIFYNTACKLSQLKLYLTPFLLWNDDNDATSNDNMSIYEYCITYTACKLARFKLHLTIFLWNDYTYATLNGNTLIFKFYNTGCKLSHLKLHLIIYLLWNDNNNSTPTENIPTFKSHIL